uniref:Uncharacterized protein n=1 Tax=Avena sativa TaxID=4498 RepID=A0ACD5XW85_AVESA
MNVRRVRVTEVSHVQPAEKTTNNNEPRDHHAASINLSPFDTMFLALPPIQRLFIYHDDGGAGKDDLPPYPALARTLRASLAATLALFTPLAGKLTARSGSDSDDLVVDCSPEAVRPGVRFVEAEYSGDMLKLARDVEHDADAFLQLVPELDVRRLPAPVLAVQVTRSAGAGAVAVGVSMHHAVADGKSLWQFMRAWAATSRDGGGEEVLLPTPTFERADILRHPKAQPAARQFARLLAPDMPAMNTLPEPDWTRQSRRTYLVAADQILSLKRRISQAAAKDQPPPTSYVAIASVLWTSIARAAKSPDQDDATDDDDAYYFLFPADCRRRLRPPLDPAFFGNCVKFCCARATTHDLCRHDADDALARAAAAVGRAIREQVEEEDPLGDVDRWAETIQGIPRERLAQQGSSHRFMAYEVDFGWGEPSRVEIVSVFNETMAMLVGARDGAVQVSVALPRDRMDGFQDSFVSQLSA